MGTACDRNSGRLRSSDFFNCLTHLQGGPIQYNTPVGQSRQEHLGAVLISHIEEIGKSDRPGHVQKLKELLIRNVDNPDFDLGKQLQDFPVCADHLRRCFEKAMGVNPKAFLLQHRMEQARQRLLNGQSVKEAALQTGFPDPNYFSRRYKLHFGQGPRAAKAVGVCPD